MKGVSSKISEEKKEGSNRETKNDEKENKDIGINENSSKNDEIIENLENELEKGEMNFDSINFNINPFNNNDNDKDNGNGNYNINNKEKSIGNDSDDLILEEKEDEDNKLELNNMQLNPKYHTSNDVLQNNLYSNENKEDKNIFNNIINFNSNSNTKDENNFYINDKNNNSRNSYNMTNMPNINYDLDANSFIPKNNNINNNNSNVNMNNINNSNNDFYSNKVRQSWICSFCHNFNSQSKNIYYFIFMFDFLKYSRKYLQQMWKYE